MQCRCAFRASSSVCGCKEVTDDTTSCQSTHEQHSLKRDYYHARYLGATEHASAVTAQYRAHASGDGEDGDVNVKSDAVAVRGDGDDLHGSDDKDAQWYRQAAVDLLAETHYKLGRMHHKGWGKAAVKNDEEAAVWYRKAANNNHGLAQHSLGMLHYMGSGVAQSNHHALKWFKKAAAQKVPGAQAKVDEIKLLKANGK